MIKLFIFFKIKYLNFIILKKNKIKYIILFKTINYILNLIILYLYNL